MPYTTVAEKNGGVKLFLSNGFKALKKLRIDSPREMVEMTEFCKCARKLGGWSANSR
jgi:hypothetical protein